MAKVFASEATGAVVYVFSDDHCPGSQHPERSSYPTRYPGPNKSLTRNMTLKPNDCALASTMESLKK
jgi:hypothetical protein